MGAPSYAKLSEELRGQLMAVPVSNGIYHPCSVRLKSGVHVDCVYFAEAARWYEMWGIWPEADRGKFAISLDDVDSIEPSPSRLPVEFAEKLYAAGESGMGYTIFTVVFADGARQAYGGGNAIDFVDYPLFQSAETVVDVLPHAGSDDLKIKNAPKYFWCLFANPCDDKEAKR